MNPDTDAPAPPPPHTHTQTHTYKKVRLCAFFTFGRISDESENDIRILSIYPSHKVKITAHLYVKTNLVAFPDGVYQYHTATDHRKIIQHTRGHK